MCVYLRQQTLAVCATFMKTMRPGQSGALTHFAVQQLLSSFTSLRSFVFGNPDLGILNHIFCDKIQFYFRENMEFFVKGFFEIFKPFVQEFCSSNQNIAACQSGEPYFPSSVILLQLLWFSCFLRLLLVGTTLNVEEFEFCHQRYIVELHFMRCSSICCEEPDELLILLNSISLICSPFSVAKNNNVFKEYHAYERLKRYFPLASLRSCEYLILMIIFLYNSMNSIVSQIE